MRRVICWLAAALQFCVIASCAPRMEGHPRNIDLGDGLKLDLAWIPPGEFLMGSPSSERDRSAIEGPQHRVTITHGFWLGKYSVTEAQWGKIMGFRPQAEPNSPVRRISWEDGQRFIKELNGTHKIPHFQFALPTEAEWEYACRAGTTTRFYTGDNEEDLAKAGWYKANSGPDTPSVGQKTPNAFGLHDMHGGVWEWCEDLKGDYPSTDVVDPTGPTEGWCHVCRGGSFRDDAPACRSASRDDLGSEPPASRIGIRVVLRREEDARPPVAGLHLSGILRTDGFAAATGSPPCIRGRVVAIETSDTGASELEGFPCYEGPVLSPLVDFPATRRASTPGNVRTVIVLRWGVQDAGDYIVRHSPTRRDEAKGYRITCTLSVLDRHLRQMWSEVRQFAGEDPPDHLYVRGGTSAIFGSIPGRQVQSYIETLPILDQ